VKIIVTTLIVSLSCLAAAGQRETSLDDPQVRRETVQRAFNELSNGTYTSWTEKYLARLGDSAAPEVMTIVTARNLTKKDAEAAVAIVKLSFAFPRNIRHEADKTPTNSFVLLDYLDQHVVEADTKSKIHSVRERIAQPIGSPQG
jgi:hypothetical protein